MFNLSTKVGDFATGLALAAAMALIWLVFTTDIVVSSVPWSVSEISWLDMVRALGG